MSRSPMIADFGVVVAFAVAASLALGGCQTRDKVTSPEPEAQSLAPPADGYPDPGLPAGDVIAEPEVPPGEAAFNLDDPAGSPAAPPDVVLLQKFVKDAKDHSQNQNDGVLLGSPSFGHGCLDQALILDGIDDCVVVSCIPELQPEAVSVEVTFKPDHLLTDGTTFEPLVVKLPSPYDFGNRVDGFDIAYQDPWGTGGRIGFGIGSRGGRLRIAANAWMDLSNDRFHHVVGTYDQEKIRLYVDGELVGTKVHRAPIAYLGGPVFIGGHIEHHLILESGRAQYFEGMIDEVAIYNRVLTPEEIRHHADRCRE